MSKFTNQELKSMIESGDQDKKALAEKIIQLRLRIHELQDRANREMSKKDEKMFELQCDGGLLRELAIKGQGWYWDEIKAATRPLYLSFMDAAAFGMLVQQRNRSMSLCEWAAGELIRDEHRKEYYIRSIREMKKKINEMKESPETFYSRIKQEIADDEYSGNRYATYGGKTTFWRKLKRCWKILTWP